jgi:hypothetical protein
VTLKHYANLEDVRYLRPEVDAIANYFEVQRRIHEGENVDDWGLAPLTAEQRRDLLEILEDRHGIRSTLATSQLPLDKWHDLIGDPTLADAILDRLVHNAYKIDLKGASMRKRNTKLTETTQPE